jgi:hypothetical protein
MKKPTSERRVPGDRTHFGEFAIKQRPAVTANGQVMWSARDLLFPSGTKKICPVPRRKPA